jgi:hypothetical protein
MCAYARALHVRFTCGRYRCVHTHSEKIDALETIIDTESRKIEECTVSPGGPAPPPVVLKDGRSVAAPLLEWGTPHCWPDGSSSNISRDFLFRGIYYPQLLRFLQRYDHVRAP